VNRLLSLLAALTLFAPAAALAQHVPAPRVAPVVVHAPSTVVHPVPIVMHPPIPPRTPVDVRPATLAQPQAIPGRYPWRPWQWNHVIFLQPAALCLGNAWGAWGMLATPTLGSTVSEEPFQVYDSYEYGSWGAGVDWPAGYGFAQAPCAATFPS